MEEDCTEKNWFKKWFNTPYYHILYKDRDDTEAKLFISKLLKEFKPTKDSHFLDLACGRGRHAVYLHQQGFEVTGMDLSDENIIFAKESEKERLHFFAGDMRENFGENRFDFILNLFTSFGYFDSLDENAKVCKQIARGLKPGGKVLIDFLNVHQLEQGLVPRDEHQIGDHHFAIERQIADEKVLKTIKVSHQGKEDVFYESVQLLTEGDFKNLLHQSGLNYEQSFGDYSFGPYIPNQSNRLIILASK